MNWANRLGLIEVRPGDGTLIRSVVPGPLVEPLSVLLERETRRALEFLQVRKVLGGWCAAEAAHRAKPADRWKLGSSLRRMTRISKAGGLLGKPDVGLPHCHRGCYPQYDHGPYHDIAAPMFQAVLRVRFVSRDPGRTPLLVAHHERIFEAIRRGDACGGDGCRGYLSRVH